MNKKNDKDDFTKKDMDELFGPSKGVEHKLPQRDIAQELKGVQQYGAFQQPKPTNFIRLCMFIERHATGLWALIAWIEAFVILWVRLGK